MHILIDARIKPHGHVGGVEQFIQGLVWGLGRLPGSGEEYSILVSNEGSGWIEPHLGKRQRILVAPRPAGESAKSLLGPLRKPLGELRSRLAGSKVPVPASDGFYEASGSDLVHFPHQAYVRCELPTIYNPHDLQHLHFPEFFSHGELARRTAVYAAGCSEASAVGAESFWARGDIINSYRIAESKVFRVSRGSPTQFLPLPSDQELKSIRKRLDLPELFGFYPAQTWPHKNHLRLLDAVAILREERIRVDLVCTGVQNQHWPAIKRHLIELRLGSQVRFLGFLPANDIRALYRLASFTVFPSLFEGGGLPLIESMSEGTAVTSSTATALVEYGSGAALFFDPESPREIAHALRKMITDSELRESLARAGRNRVSGFTWQNCALVYRAIYRLVGGASLEDDDLELLERARRDEPPSGAESAQ